VDITPEELAMIPEVGTEAFAMYCYMKSISVNGVCDPSYYELRDKLSLAFGTISNCIKKLVIVNAIKAKRNYSARTTYTLPVFQNLEYSPPVLEVMEATTTLLIDSLKSSNKIPNNGGLDNSIPNNGGLERVATLQDAQQMIMQITGWSRIPGNPEDSTHALGAVIDIFSTRDDAKDWITECYSVFRMRYPRSTRIFWLIDWAVQGVIPEERKNGQPKEDLSYLSTPNLD
jgi:hypothetical protein